MLQPMGARASFGHVLAMAAKPDEDVSERKLLGKALRSLRERARLSQEAAAEAFAQIAKPKGREEFTGQAWSAYETGVRTGLHSPTTQTRLAAAVGASREELHIEAARLRGDRPHDRSGARSLGDRGPAPFEGFPQGNTQRMRMPDDNLRPWANSGAIIVYDVDQWPRPDEGCVLESLDGTRKTVKLFVSADAENFHLAELYPQRKELTLPRAEYNAYRVVARIG